MDRTKTTYDFIKNNIIFEGIIYYKKDKKQCVGCIVKSKYGDNSDQMELYLFENKAAKQAVICLDLINYEKAEKSVEQKKETGWIASRAQKILFNFELMPKHDKQRELFACETDENRNKWLIKLNEIIEQLKTNDIYRDDSYQEMPNEKVLTKEDEGNSTFNARLAPVIPPKKEQKRSTSTSSPSQSTALVEQLNYVLLKPKKLNENDILYRGTFDDLHKILCEINKSGVYAVTQKVTPEFDCNLAIRVYESEDSPILSWNIYENQKTKEYFVSENGQQFSNIVDLCSYYTSHDLPSISNTINRLIVPYKHYHH